MYRHTLLTAVLCGNWMFSWCGAAPSLCQKVSRLPSRSCSTPLPILAVLMLKTASFPTSRRSPQSRAPMTQSGSSGGTTSPCVVSEATAVAILTTTPCKNYVICIEIQSTAVRRPWLNVSASICFRGCAGGYGRCWRFLGTLELKFSPACI